MAPGLIRRTLVSEGLMICRFDLDQGVEIPTQLSTPMIRRAMWSRDGFELLLMAKVSELGPRG